MVLVRLMVIGILMAGISGTSSGLANVGNLSNMSVEWIRTSNRNAATDAADIVVYNPSGLPELSKGLHLNFGNQTFIRQPKHSFTLGSGPKEYEQESADIFVPITVAC